MEPLVSIGNRKHATTMRRTPGFCGACNVLTAPSPWMPLARAWKTPPFAVFRRGTRDERAWSGHGAGVV